MGINKIFFVHTVGTAGGDFAYYLQHLYHPKSFICAPDIKRKNENKLNSPILRSKYIEDLLIEQYRSRTKKGDQIDLIYGHIPYLKDYRSIFHKDFKLMTLVRNPVKRFVTHYRKLIYKSNICYRFITIVFKVIFYLYL